MTTSTTMTRGIIKDYSGKVVLITGGTKGLGLATGLAFARHGAKVYLTHRWGSADEDAIRARFAEQGGPAPVILEADASRDKETQALLERIRTEHDAVDVLISNVCVVMRGQGVEAHSRRALIKSLDYSAWPFVGYMQRIKKVFGRYPSYALAMSSDGPDSHYPGYDYVAVAKAVLETFVRYMATHVGEAEEPCCVNALRTRQVLTDSYKQIFGDEVRDLADSFPEFAITVDEVGDAALALCGGLFDSLSGQVIMLDQGAAFADNVATLGPRIASLFAPQAAADTEKS
jgi:NAD(P)-dependent dehydrogenase (short-subunit alcohol dehydrogenase family)